MRAPLICVGLLALIVPGAQIAAQSTPRADSMAAQNGFFSGFVSELTPNSLTVSRKGPNRENVQRVFLMNAQTKVEGRLRVNARVTVRFEPSPDGDRAIRIIVR